MATTRILTDTESTLSTRLDSLQQREAEYALRRLVLESKITLGDIIANSFVEPHDDDALQSLAVIRRHQSDAYSRLAGWHRITVFFRTLRDATLVDLETSLSS